MASMAQRDTEASQRYGVNGGGVGTIVSARLLHYYIHTV